ncbi:hypothetical protein GCM10027262_31740 [Nocardia tengchongensis]
MGIDGWNAGGFIGGIGGGYSTMAHPRFRVRTDGKKEFPDQRPTRTKERTEGALHEFRTMETVPRKFSRS